MWSPACTSVPSGKYAVIPSEIPSTRPSWLRVVVAGCTEQPDTAVDFVGVSQSGIADPLDVFVPGLMIVIEC